MDEAAGVGGSEGVGDLGSYVEKLGDLERPAVKTLAEGLPFEQFHGQVGASPPFADVVKAADVGVFEDGGGAGFAAEALDEFGVAGKFREEHFESYLAPETFVHDAVDFGHATRADTAEDTIRADGLGLVIEQGGSRVPAPRVIFGLVVREKQGPDLSFEVLIVEASVAKPLGTRGGIDLKRLVEDFGHFGPAVGCHRFPGPS